MSGHTHGVTLITGGARSGKSAFALETASAFGPPRVFIATAQPLDEEMRRRIVRHQADRGNRFATVEAPCDLAGALARIPEGTRVVVIDCLTVWLGNLMHHGTGAGTQSCPEIEALYAALQAPPCRIILVTNEVGMGLVPGEAGSREYRDLLGEVNRRMAELADEVVLLVSGLPLRLK